MHISGTQRLFSAKYLFGEVKLPRIFYSLRKTKNLLDDHSMHVQFSNPRLKIPGTENAIQKGIRKILTFVKL